MTPGLARIKRAVKLAVELSGGGDGAAATVGRQRSVTYDWANINHRAFPPIDCAQALDEVAIAQGRRPPIVSALASELGGVFVPLPQAHGGDDAVPQKVMEVAAEVGDVSRKIAEGLADDNVLNERETLGALDELGELEARVAELRLLLEHRLKAVKP